MPPCFLEGTGDLNLRITYLDPYGLVLARQ